MKRFIFLVFFIEFYIITKIYAQPPKGNIILYSINEESGLSDNHVQCVLKDRNSYVWIGTTDGLNLIDGSSLNIFRHNNKDSASLVNNDVLSLAEDAQGNIWVGTADGLSCYDKQKKIFISYIPPISPYGAAFYFYSIVMDKKQNIWCGTDGGLFLFDPAGKIFHPYYNIVPDKKNNISLRNKLTHMIADKNENKLWLSSADGIWSFDCKNFQYKKEITANNDPSYERLFTYVYESHDNKIWAGNWGNGLEELDRNSGKVVHYPLRPGHGNIVRCINEIRQTDGKYFLWLDGDLSAFDPFTRSFFNYTKLPLHSETLNTFPCYQSSDGWVWLASSSGLYIYNPQRQFFQHHFFPKSITPQDIIFGEWNNLLAVGGQAGNFLKLYDNSWNVKKDFGSVLRLSSGKNINQPNAALLSLSIQNNNTFWSANSEGIVKINATSGRTEWYRHSENDSSSMPRNFISHLFFDSYNKLWIFPWREGIWTMDTLSGKCKKLWDGFIIENGKPKKLLIAAAAEDKNGNIWMADLDEGIILFERKTGKFSKPFAKETGEKVHTSSVFYRNGFLYAATVHSLLKWNETSRQIQFFDLPEEMSKEIYDIYPDKTGNWWITTKNGLVVFNEADRTFKRFTSADGLLNNDMNGRLFCRHDGTLVFGNANFITTFNPDKFLTAVSSVPAVELKEILVNEKTVQWNALSNLRFNYRSKNIIFKWALPDFSNSFHNQYYCKLQGIDADWRYVGNKGEIQYANLSAGQYKIQLKASNANGVASSDIITIAFEVEPPFWKTIWFTTLLFIALITVFGLVVRYVSQRNLKEKLLRLEKEQAIEKERNRISHDMHDDLGSGLTKIAIMSEVVKKQLNEPEKAKQQLENISESSRELVDNLQDIIWVLNPRNDVLESLAAYIREYALKFFEPFGTNVQFDYPEKFPEIKLSEEARRNVFLTVKESLNNIVKHAWCNKTVISIVKNQTSIILTIKDDGRGFDVNKVREFANGLLNMKNRIEQIGGKYEIYSETGKGTKTIITIPV